ncbi:MAG: hypothetical protein LBJ48_02080, partial [Coriobacteriales bacterium]|nr:hypothetical protein [Coriobacteriales bacterium]
MKYLTYTPALNLISPLETDGDWHYSTIDWPHIELEESEESIFGQWGLYRGEVPTLGEAWIADHVRALLDLLDRGYFGSAQG